MAQGDTFEYLLSIPFSLIYQVLNDLTPHVLEPDSIPPKLLHPIMRCLLHANGLVILSTAAEGLQTSFSKPDTIILQQIEGER